MASQPDSVPDNVVSVDGAMLALFVVSNAYTMNQTQGINETCQHALCCSAASLSVDQINQQTVGADSKHRVQADTSIMQQCSSAVRRRRRSPCYPH